MPREPLPPDPDSLDKWRQMAQTPPSKDALPPASGGTRWARGLLILVAVLMLLALLVQWLQGMAG